MPALLCQANNHLLRKLAHGRELSLILLGIYSDGVAATELLSKQGPRDLDTVAQVRGRMDIKQDFQQQIRAPQVIAEHIQGWLPIRTTRNQHEITQLRHQLAEKTHGKSQLLVGDETCTRCVFPFFSIKWLPYVLVLVVNLARLFMDYLY